MQARIKEAAIDAFRSLRSIAPMILAVIGLVGLFEALVTPQMLKTFFNGSLFHDTVVGTVAGAISVGQPFVSYIIGGELLDAGVSFYAVTAFILSFVTLGVVQIPLEWGLFGARFTLVRNLLALLFAFIIAFLTVITLEFFR